MKIRALHIDVSNVSFFIDSGPPGCYLSDSRVTRIEESSEPGHMARIPIYLVYCDFGNGEQLFQKVPSCLCRVQYEVEKT